MVTLSNHYPYDFVVDPAVNKPPPIYLNKFEEVMYPKYGLLIDADPASILLMKRQEYDSNHVLQI